MFSQGMKKGNMHELLAVSCSEFAVRHPAFASTSCFSCLGWCKGLATSALLIINYHAFDEKELGPVPTATVKFWGSGKCHRDRAAGLGWLDSLPNLYRIQLDIPLRWMELNAFRNTFLSFLRGIMDIIIFNRLYRNRMPLKVRRDSEWVQISLNYI